MFLPFVASIAVIVGDLFTATIWPSLFRLGHLPSFQPAPYAPVVSTTERVEFNILEILGSIACALVGVICSRAFKNWRDTVKLLEQFHSTISDGPIAIVAGSGS